ncbi:reverse transcriptase domain, reverse transcriptase zinc-binding domain protein, partial [Tanacetum coccineum]
RVDTILNSANVEVTGTDVANAFVSHYENFLGSDMVCDMVNSDGLFVKQVLENSYSNMVSPITYEEIKSSMFSIGDDRAPGPDDFSLLKEINHTFLALIPKVPTPLKVIDFRLISGCNVIYKCISKILTNRIIKGVKEVVSDNQSAFVLGRRISDNILITQELMHNYHQNRGPPRSCYQFKSTSGLVPSLPKSTAFFCNASNHTKLAIPNIMPFSEGELPVKYLGVPLISSRLLNKDCKILVDRVKNKIGRISLCYFPVDCNFVNQSSHRCMFIGLRFL